MPLRQTSTSIRSGASEGAPSAQQIADRWHILKNLREVLERLLGRVHARLKQHYDASGDPVRSHGKHRRTRNEIQDAQAARLRREACYEAVVSLYQQGPPVLRIADDLHMSRTTVRKFVAAGAFPERAAAIRSRSILDPYIPYLKQRLTEGPTSASHLWPDLQQQGFSGGYNVVARWLQAQGWHLQKGRSSQARKLQEDLHAITPTADEPMREQAVLVSPPGRQSATLREPLESYRSQCIIGSCDFLVKSW